MTTTLKKTEMGLSSNKNSVSILFSSMYPHTQDHTNKRCMEQRQFKFCTWSFQSGIGNVLNVNVQAKSSSVCCKLFILRAYKRWLHMMYFPSAVTFLIEATKWVKSFTGLLAIDWSSDYLRDRNGFPAEEFNYFKNVHFNFLFSHKQKASLLSGQNSSTHNVLHHVTQPRSRVHCLL